MIYGRTVGNRLILMFNKNSGARTLFYSSKTALLLLFLLVIAFSQTCLQSSGSACIRCASGYQLVAGGCVSMTGTTSNPILVFMDIPGVQKKLYSVSNAILTTNTSSDQPQQQQSVVNEFEVVKVNSSSPGNYYQVRANSIRAVQDFKDLFSNSSMLTEDKKMLADTSKSDSSQENATLDNDHSPVQQMKQTDSKSNEGVKLTAIKQAVSQQNGLQPTLTSIKKITNVPTSSTLSPIQQKDTQAHLQPIKHAIDGVEPVLVPIKPQQLSSQTEVSPSQETSLTKIIEGIVAPDTLSDSKITSSNQNNQELLVQLQQISQKLTQINQAYTLTQAKINQPSVIAPATFTQASKKEQQTSNGGGVITLQLTQVGQQLTRINQQLTQAKMAQNSSNSSDISTIEDASSAEISNSLPIQVKINQKYPNVAMNLSQFVSPVPTPQPAQTKLIPINQLTPLHWVKATRYQLYNLTLVAKALTQVRLKQTTSTTNDNLLTFKCSSNLTIFLLPKITDQSPTLEVQYSKYISNILAKAAKQLHDYTLADDSTLCFDPPFNAAFKLLNERHKTVIADLPLLAVYYQFCGFAKTFRVFFLDDTALPAITIHQAVVVVDLYRMAPAQVFFTDYATTTL